MSHSNLTAVDQCFLGWSAKLGNSQGRCCCNCRYQVEIMRHPGNNTAGDRMKGLVTEIAGYGCKGVYEGQKIIFSEHLHGMCEIHDWVVSQ